MERRRSVTASAALLSLLLLVGVACGAPAGDGAGEAGVPTVAPPSEPPPSEPAPPATTSRPTSELADRVRPLDSARYDPAEHAAPARTVTGLSLPALGVEVAPVEPVGVEPNGEMEIPPADEVGWYRFGAAPGEAGSAVLAAHVAYDGVDGVFRDLDRLDAGDEVAVTFDDGTTASYRVTEVVTHAKDALPDDLFARRGPERLVLITCGGDFNPSLRSYEDNVVATAVPA